MYTTNTMATADVLAALGGFLITTVLIALIATVVLVIANWKIFKKAGEPGWAAIIPFYNSYIFAKITWGNGWMFLVAVACAIAANIASDIAWLFLLLSLAYTAITYWKLSKAFGHDIGFAVGMFFLGIVFFPILGFGKDQYLGVPQDALSLKNLKKE